jgi:YcxB-like protein
LGTIRAGPFHNYTTQYPLSPLTGGQKGEGVETVELAYTMTADDIHHGARIKTKATRMGRFALAMFPVALVSLALAMVVFGVLAGAGALEPDDWQAVALGIVGLGLLGLIVVLRRRIYRQLAARMGSLRASIDDQSVRMTNEYSSTVNDWSAYGSYVETDRAFVLLSPDRGRLMFTVLPKRGLADEADARRLREILARHLG